MLSFCLKFNSKKIIKTDTKSSKFAEIKTRGIMTLSNVQFAVIKYQNFLNSKRLLDY